MARRILVALDSPDTGERLLEAAARLAAGRQAELVGLFIEESDFVEAANLPFSKVLSPRGGAWQALDPRAMERALRARARELEAALTELAGRWQVQYSFRTARGGADECLIAAAANAELVVLGRSRRGRAAYLGRTARRAVRECQVNVLVLGGERPAPARITAFYAGDAGVLAAAQELAAIFGRPLEVAVLAADHDAGERRRAEVEAWLHSHGVPAGIRVLDTARPQDLAQAVRGRDAGVAVISARASDGGIDLEALLDALDIPVLIVRT